ncbi:MAG: ABC transporter substrate binding protein, partial [Angelakisella sp.]
MKKLLSLLLVAAMAASAVGCGTAATAPKLPRIGIVQLVEHSALDEAYKGFVEGLKEAGYEDGKNVTIDYQNAQGEQANCVTIADKLINDKSDLILA